MATEKQLEDARAEVARIEREMREERLAAEDAQSESPIEAAFARKRCTREVWAKMDGKQSTAFFKSGGRLVG